jgi:hypothetical protein
MKTKDLVTITSVAVGTAALTVAFMSNPLEAGSGGNPLAATIAQPKLTAAGVELTLAAVAGRVFKAGDQPAFELRAVNTLAKPSAVTVTVALSSTAPSSPYSRVLLMPSVLWQEQRALTLGPKETKVFTFNASTNVPANSDLSISLSASDKPVQTTAAGSPEAATAARIELLTNPGIVALKFSTVTPEAKGVLASIRK